MSEERLKRLEEVCERRGWRLITTTATQREPRHEVLIRVPGENPLVTLRADSHDSLTVALARIELALQEISKLAGDSYMNDPPEGFGTLR